MMALTATATERVRQDVLGALGMPNAQLFAQSFNRPNLSYSLRPKAGFKVTLRGYVDFCATYTKHIHSQLGCEYY